MSLKPHTTLRNMRTNTTAPDVDQEVSFEGDVSSDLFGGLGEGFGGFHLDAGLVGRPDPTEFSLENLADYRAMRAAREDLMRSKSAQQSFMDRFAQLYARLSPSERLAVRSTVSYLEIPIQRVSTTPRDNRAIGSVPN